MLISCRFYIFGLHLLLLSHIAHSFVLTVDVEDLKKLAQKFVSESVADRLTNFVYRATKNMIDKNAKSSEEKDTIDAENNSHRISEENIMDDSYLRSGQSKELTQESNSNIESDEDKTKEKDSVFKSNDDDVKRSKDEKVKSRYLKNENTSSPDKVKKTHNKTTKSAHYKRHSVSNKTDEGIEKHDTADKRAEKDESKPLKDVNTDIEIPKNEFRQFTGLQRSQDLDGETTEPPKPELDMFDIKVYKKTDEDASKIGNEGDVKWWEKELPRRQYFENFPNGRNVGPE